MVHQSNLGKKSHNMMSAEQRRLLALHNNDKPTVNFSEHFFNKVGACFNQLQKPMTDVTKPENCIKPKVAEELFKFGQRLLSKELLALLDKTVADFYAKGEIISFPYKTFAESMTFTVTSFMRELLQSSNGKLLKA